MLEITDRSLPGPSARQRYGTGSRPSEVRYLLHGFKLLFEASEISYIPRVGLLEGENICEGLINWPEFEAGVEKITDSDVQDIVKFFYNSASRSGEAKKLQWRKSIQRIGS